MTTVLMVWTFLKTESSTAMSKTHMESGINVLQFTIQMHIIKAERWDVYGSKNCECKCES